jgi:pantetheine-phosphate adenylyltransferase
VIRQALRLCDRLVLAIGIHPGKAPLFSAEERLAMLDEIAGPLAAAEDCQLACTTFDDLVIAAAEREGATTLIRGLRDATDFDYEMQMALMNRHLAPDLETVFMVPSLETTYISSSLVKQVAQFGGDVSGLVPPNVAAALKTRFATE